MSAFLLKVHTLKCNTKISQFCLHSKSFDKTSANMTKNQERNRPQAMPLSAKAVAFQV
nr:MAG TPA: hypothetical protein [Caudoviricetes sp.]